MVLQNQVLESRTAIRRVGLEDDIVLPTCNDPTLAVLLAKSSIDSRTDALIVKLSAERVAQLVQEGVGSPFAPAGRTFREWVALPTADRRLWGALLDEAWMNAGRSATQR